jgi:hypothetical protein
MSTVNIQDDFGELFINKERLMTRKIRYLFTLWPSVVVLVRMREQIL